MSSTKKQNSVCHFITSTTNYHMTCISTNDKCLKLGISLKFDWLQKALLTQSRCHDRISTPKSCQCLTPPQTNFLDSPLATKLQRPLLQPSHWSLRHMAHYKFPLLIIIPGIHSLTCLTTPRSLVT